MNKKITKDTNLAELLLEHPEAAEVLADYELYCVGCPASGLDTIEAGAKVHGFDDELIKEMVERINEVIAFKE